MMNTSTLTAAAPTLAALTRLATLGVQRRGDTLRCKMPAATVSPTQRHELTKSLLEAGAGVQICEQSDVWTATLAADGNVVWEHRATPRSREYVTVVVTL